MESIVTRTRVRPGPEGVQKILKEATTYSGGWTQASKPPDPAWIGNFTNYTLTGRFDSTMTDTLTPGYYRLLREGKPLPVNPMSQTLYPDATNLSVHLERRVWTMKDHTTPKYRTWYHLTARHIGPVPELASIAWQNRGSEPPNLVQDAIGNLRRQLFDLGTFLAELPKTLSLVSKAWGSFRDRADYIASRGKRGKGAWRQFESAWLEARYGWRPLLYDMMAAKAAMENLGKGLQLVTGASKDVSNNSSVSAWTNVGAGRTLLRYRVRRQWEVDWRGFALGRLDLNNPFTFDPLLTAWEVVPYSFVIDWFIDIGGMLRAWSPFARGDILAAGVSSRLTEVRMLEVDFPNVSYIGDLVSDEQHSSGSPHLVRKVSSRQSRDIGASLPGVTANLSAAKFLDLVTLATAYDRNLKKRIRI